ncbi:hypothetical protein [Pyrodictium abyssi]|uniref:PIN domain-containing protein n=1 Tax=Pyrodictium abyssi TaxID=54256 RepID=A0ABM8IY41_9CREN|nr:hypothetical protein PABY_06500 [Pyrodictium abyssi]
MVVSIRGGISAPSSAGIRGALGKASLEELLRLEEEAHPMNHLVYLDTSIMLSILLETEKYQAARPREPPGDAIAEAPSLSSR